MGFEEIWTWWQIISIEDLIAKIGRYGNRSITWKGYDKYSWETMQCEAPKVRIMIWIDLLVKIEQIVKAADTENEN